MSDDQSDQQINDRKLELWKVYEDVAMHFNELIIKLRTQALGGITAISALAGIAVNFTNGPATAEQWHIVSGILCFLLFAWVAIAVLDLCYYHTLLLGAVDALLQLERGSDITLSTAIEKRFGRGQPEGSEADSSAKRWFFERAWPLAFYLIVLVALLIGLAYACLVHEAQLTSQCPRP